MFKRLAKLFADFLKKEDSMSDMSVINNAPAPAPATPVAEVAPVPVETKVETVVKTGVQDFEKAVAFLEHGIAVLGEDARDEIMALARKYL